jgi:hypothetical protein
MVRTLGLAGALALGLSACSGQQEEMEEAVEAAEDAEEMAEEVVEEEPAEEPEAVVEEAPEPEAVEPVAETMKPVVEAKRVVRFVTENGVSVYSQAKAGASEVGKLNKGDRILVIEEGDWARITDSMFIKVEDLSSKAVARERTKRVWSKPAH